MKITTDDKRKFVLYTLLALVILLGWAVNLSAQSDYKVAEQDSLALVAFYWATDGPNWTSNQEGFGFDDLTSEWQEKYDGNFNNWFDGPVKDWFGIKVEKRAIENTTDSIYRVTWLWPVIGRRTDGQNGLKGYVPREIGLLTALEHFRVNGNDGFRDELVPDELYQASLQHLDTEAAWFGGGLSDALRNCLGMRKLNVRYNNYDFMPNLDFLDEEGLRNLDGTQWFYNSRFSYFYMERIVDYFYSVSPNIKEFGFEARDMFDVGDEIEIVAPVGTSVEMICNDAGSREEEITYQWFKDGLSKFGKKSKTYTISSVKESDYGHYTTRITNEYVKAYDQNGNYGEVFTKGIHLVPEPVAPIIERGVVANNGQYIDLFFSKPMVAGSYNNLVVQAGSRSIAVTQGAVRGRIDKEVRIFLAEPVLADEVVSLSLAATGINDKNGGVLSTFSDLPMENRTRPEPMVTDAKTTLDGSGLLIQFDQYIDPSTLSSANFEVQGASTYTVSSTTLVRGEIDQDISKQILLTLAEDIVDSAEVITVQYLSGQLAGLYAGTVQATDQIPVLNQVTVEKTDVKFRFEDGSALLSNVLIQGSWKVDPIQLYDDGTNGDETANDHVWTYQASLVDDQYTWDVISRATSNAIDTVETIDPNTGNTVLILNPITLNVDSMLSENILLNFSILDELVSGDTVYGIFNRDVLFNVGLTGGGSEIYLMGIANDWNEGQLMSASGDNAYTYTLPKLTAGDVIEYNYRQGSDWENLTPESRSYTVKNGENIINDQFGIFTGVEEDHKPDLKIYPNPSSNGLIMIEGIQDFNRFEIFDIAGRLIQGLEFNKQSDLTLDLSKKAKGMYWLIGTSDQGARHAYKIFLQ